MKTLEQVERPYITQGGVQDAVYEEFSELKELQAIEKKTHEVKELTLSVSTLLATQHESLTTVESNTDLSTEHLINGVQMLAQVKLSEANKHTTRGSLTTAAIAGVSGLMIGGPLGLLIGAVSGATLGGVIGNQLTSLSKSSILQELLNLQRINVLTVLENGDLACKLEVYQLERRTFSLKVGWERYKRPLRNSKVKHTWTNGIMKELSYNEPNPERYERSHQKMDPKRFLPYVLGNDVFVACKREIHALEWKWAKGGWKVDYSRARTDSAGWDYAYSSESTDWYEKAAPTSFVRRRKWVHYIFGRQTGLSQTTRGKAKFSASSSVRKESLGRAQRDAIPLSPDVEPTADPVVQAEVSKTLGKSLRTFEEIEDISEHNLNELDLQGGKLATSLRQALLVKDTTEYAERINRAASVTGIIRNITTRPKLSSSKADQLLHKRNREAPMSPKHAVQATRSSTPSLNDGQAGLDKLDVKVSSNLDRAKVIQEQVTEQNDTLDEIDRGVTAAKTNLSYIARVFE